MTIHQLRKPCFMLDPSPWDDDAGVPHYPTRYKARKELAGVRGEHDDDDTEVLAECDGSGCKDTLGDEEEGPSCIHFDTADEVIAWMPGESWTRTGPDGALCWAHSPEDVTPLPPSPRELEAAGQLRLIP